MPEETAEAFENAEPAVAATRWISVRLPRFAAGATTVFLLACFYLWLVPLIGVSPDSCNYLAAAESLRNGLGLQDCTGEPFRHWPPLYPAILSWFPCSLVETAEAARRLNAVLYALNALLLWRLCRALSADSKGFAFLACGLFLFSGSAGMVHWMAWSEPLFLFFLMLCFLFFYASLKSESRIPVFLLGVAAGSACLTRYVGVVLLPSVAVSLLFFDVPRPFKRRLQRTTGFLATASVFPAWWLGRALVIYGTATDRTLAWHRPGLGHVKSAFGTLVDFIAPWFADFSSPYGALAGAALLFAAAVLGFRLTACAVKAHRTRRCSDQEAAGVSLLVLIAVFATSYAALLVLSITLADATTPVDLRMLAPEEIALLLLLAGAWGMSASHPHAGSTRKAVVLVLLASLALRLPYTWIVRRSGRWMEFNSATWRGSPTVQAAATLGGTRPAVTNSPEVMWFLVHRRSRRLPLRYDPTSFRPNPRFNREMTSLGDRTATGETTIVLFARIQRGCLPSERELLEMRRLPVLARTPDGIIFGTSNPPRESRRSGGAAAREERGAGDRCF